MALETYSRHGHAALQHLRKLVRAQAARLPEAGDGAAGALLLRWGCRLSVALHRANAQNLRRGLGADATAASLRLALAESLAG